MDTFNATPNSNLRSIPFSRKGLKEHQASLFTKWLIMEIRREKHSITRPIRVGMENEKW